MSLKNKIYKLKGTVQHYAWGGYDFIPSLLGEPIVTQQPWAEYWMGAHPSASSLLIEDNNTISLYDAIINDPEKTLGSAVFNEFGELPYLLKVLDVRDMLSIQVHPSRSEAIKGFDAEEAAGIPINAPNRNYKDRNHKPEVMVALSEFWLLHGFKEETLLERVLEDILEFNVFIPLFKKEGIKGLYQFIMEMSQEDIDHLLHNLVKKEISRKRNHALTKDQPGWWVAKLFDHADSVKNIDRGIFSIYFFNIVKVEKGEAIFQGEGIPHAYLEGQNVELMANSDNVLRGGLTPKYIDVPELIKHTSFTGIKPVVMKGNSIDGLERNYPCPVADFGINRIELAGNNTFGSVTHALEIVLITEGACVIDDGNTNLVLKKGESAAIFPNHSFKIVSSGYCEIFRAFVPFNNK